MNTQRQRPASKQEHGLMNASAPVFSMLPIPPYELQPAAVLPEQFYDAAHAGRHESGAVALIRAMLDDAIACYQKLGSAKGRRNQRIAKEAEAWLFSDDDHWPFAFVNVCAVLAMEPDYVRRGLKRWRRASFSQARPKRRLTGIVRHDLPIAA